MSPHFEIKGTGTEVGEGSCYHYTNEPYSNDIHDIAAKWAKENKAEIVEVGDCLGGPCTRERRA